MTDPTPTPPADGKLLKPDSLGAKALGAVGLGVGLAFGKYCGALLFVPSVVGGLVAWVLSKTLPVDRKPLVAAGAVAVGHIGAMLLTLILAARSAEGFESERALYVGLDVVIYALGLLWLLASPSWVSAGALLFYQALSIVANVYLMSTHAGGSSEHKMYVAAIGLLLFAMTCLIAGMRTISKARQAELDSHFASTPRP